MPSAALLRTQIEAALAKRIPSALTPISRALRPVAATGIPSVDQLLDGGLPLGAITEMVGPECSGRTSLALSFLARLTQTGKVCAWIDVSNTLDPASAASIGVNLNHLLWVRCGVPPAPPPQPAAYTFTLPEQYRIPPPTTKGLHGGGHGPHPRTEIKGLSNAVSEFLRPEIRDELPPEALHCNCADPQRRPKEQHPTFQPSLTHIPTPFSKPVPTKKPWDRLDQALRATDLLLQAGGFSSIVLDLASISPEYASRVPLATWFRYRAAAERTQASFLLLTQHACAKSSAALVLRMQPGQLLHPQSTVFTGLEHSIEVQRERFAPTNVIPLRKPPKSERAAHWHSRPAWATQA